jgi:hypothetical protein
MTPEICEDIFERLQAAQLIEAQDRLADYLRRGRRYGALSMVRVRVIYIKSECDMALRAPYSQMSAEGHDAEAELTMRGEPLPEAEVAPARELIRNELISWYDAHPEARNEDVSARMYKTPKWVN